MTPPRWAALAGLFLLSFLPAALAAPRSGEVPAADRLVRTGAVPLGEGTAVAARRGLPDQVFHNPAGLAAVRDFTLVHNHSARHYPLDREVDQLDADTQEIIVPLAGAATYGFGTTFRGEHGWDYRGLAGTDWEDRGFPVDMLRGWRDVHAFSLTALPMLDLGGAIINQHHREYNRAGELERFRDGDGRNLGVIAGPSGLTWGYARQRVDQTVHGRNFTEQKSIRRERQLTGWSVSPTGWLTLSRQTTRYRTEHSERDNPETAGTASWGVRLDLGMGLTLLNGRWGDSDTFGLRLQQGPLALRYAEADNFLGKILGGELPRFRDVHMYGFELSF